MDDNKFNTILDIRDCKIGIIDIKLVSRFVITSNSTIHLNIFWVNKCIY